jgi:hypothetical protein
VPDLSVHLWSAATGRELAVDCLDAGKKQLTVTPACYFMASPHGADVIRWRQSAKLWPLAKFRRRVERPDLLRRTLTGPPIGMRSMR